jgi:hypothetical protein
MKYVLPLVLLLAGCSTGDEKQFVEPPISEPLTTPISTPEPTPDLPKVEPPADTFVERVRQWRQVEGIIPSNCKKYKRYLTRQARKELGVDAPVSWLGAQIFKESTCREDAKSPFAEGLTQFTPQTAEWVGEKWDDLGVGDVYDPHWAIRAQIFYMRYLVANARGENECEAWAKAASAYNGGIGWLRRDEKVTEEAGANKLAWWDNVEIHKDSRRSAASVRENTNYPLKITLEIQSLFYQNGWGGSLICEDKLYDEA